MIRLWGRKTSSNVMKVLWTLDELGLPYERIDVGGAFGGTATPEYRTMQPIGLVPAIEDCTFHLFESNAIIRYLCNAHAPTSPLYPAAAEARATVDAWLDFQQTALGPPHTVFFLGLVRTPPEKRNMDAIVAAIREAGAIWSIIDARIARLGWVAADHLTLADIALGPHIHRWFALDLPERPNLPHVRAWYDRLLALPAYSAHCAGALV